jgi:hypothetical protein
MSGPQTGDVILIGPTAGAQFAGGRHLIMRVSKITASKSWDGMAWIDGYVLNPQGVATERREVYVQVNGLRPVARAANRHAETVNGGPRLPRQRITTTTPRPTGSTR